MKNTKELQPILAAIHCINYVNKHGDPDILQITDYAFRRLFGANTNLLSLVCIGKTKEQIMPDILKMLENETMFQQYLDEYKER